MINLGSNFRHAILLIWIALISTCVVLFYPGSMTWDSYDQFLQANMNEYRDWQPPFMAIIWSYLLKLTQNAGSLFVLQCTLLYMSCILLYLKYIDSRYSIVFLLAPFLPWIINFEFVVWKDVLMGNFFLFALSFVLFTTNYKYKLPKLLFSGLVVLIGSLLRHNSLPAAIPLIIFICYSYFDRSIVRIVLFVIGYVTLFFILSYLISTVYEVKKNFPFVYVMFDDIVGLYRMGVGNYIPFVKSQGDIIKLVSCNTEVGFAFCVDSQIFDKVDSTEYNIILNVWKSLIFSHPIEYAEYRLTAFMQYVRLPTLKPTWFYHFDVMEVFQNQQIAYDYYQILRKLLVSFFNFVEKYIFFTFTPFFWLFFAFISIWICLRRSATKLILVLMSGILYQLSYIVTAPTYDFRFSFWPVLSVIFVLIICLNTSTSITRKFSKGSIHENFK